MNKTVLALFAASSAMAAVPAAAQTVTGTVNINGTVASKCFVLPGGGTTFGTAVGSPVLMGELAQADGTLKASSTLATTFGTVATNANLGATVVCTSTGASVEVDADPLVNTAAGGSGYTNTVDYTANVEFVKVTGSQTVSNATTAAASTASLGARLDPSGTNVKVTTSGWTATGILVAGNYDGKITIRVSPAV